MAEYIQYDFFDDVDFREEEIKVLDVKIKNVRQGVFKRVDLLSKSLMMQQEKIDRLESRIYALEKYIMEHDKDAFGYDGTFKLDRE